MAVVYLQCVSVARKERIRIVSPGYVNSSNCRFPRAIREVGKYYSVPAANIKLSYGPRGTAYYIVKNSGIQILDGLPLTGGGGKDVGGSEAGGEGKQVHKPEQMYMAEEPDCVICFEPKLGPNEDGGAVLVPCGHYALCDSCANQLIKSGAPCPICRGKIQGHVKPSQMV